MKVLTLVGAALVVASSLSVQNPEKPPHVDDADIVDAYHYMLGRWVALRQEAVDLKREFRWNELYHRDPGAALWTNPASDVAYSEAWIYVDATSCTVLELPVLDERSYSVRIFNGWGEITARIDKHAYPQHPFGRFAFCLQGARVPFAAGTQRIGLPNKKSRLVLRIDLAADPKATLALQKRVTLRQTGAPKVDSPPADFAFANDNLPGVEAFDSAEEILLSEPDVDKEMDALQAKTLTVAKAAEDPAQRVHINAVILQDAIPKFLAAIPQMGPMHNGWVYPRAVGHYRGDYLMRSIAQFTGLWSSNGSEAIYFGSGGLDGNVVYTQTFPKDALPIKKWRYRWSVAVIDSEKYQALRSSENRGSLDKLAPLKYNADGSLTLAFGPEQPSGIAPSNWLPTPAGRKYSMAYRIEGPDLTANGTHIGANADAGDVYYPPVLVKRY